MRPLTPSATPRKETSVWKPENTYMQGHQVHFEGSYYEAVSHHNTSDPTSHLHNVIFLSFGAKGGSHIALTAIELLVAGTLLIFVISSKEWTTYGAMLMGSYCITWFCIESRRKSLNSLNDLYQKVKSD